MTRAHKRLLTRRALAKSMSGPGLMLKVQALADLLRAGEAPPLLTVRRELLRVMGADADTYQAGRAVTMAGRLLEQLDRPAVPEPDEDPDLRREWFELDLALNVAMALGWDDISPIEWNRGESRRVQEVMRVGNEILAAPDPDLALERWRESRSA